MTAPFLRDSVRTLLESLVAAGCQFDLFRPEGFPGNKHYLKHDIHGDISISLRIAKIERDLGIKATYFCLHQHPYMAPIWNKPDTWAMLREIQDMGHEVALHVDPFILVKMHGDVEKGIIRELVKFYEEKINIRGGNCHGNTSFTRPLNFNPRCFFVEFNDPHHCEYEEWNKHYHQYSVKRMGFSFWADQNVWFPERGIVDLYYCTDTYGEFGADKTQEQVEAIVKKVRGAACLYLLHPQFYIPKEA